jgi:chromate transporter
MAAILSGLRPAVLALILVALLKLGKTTMKGGLSILVTTASFVAMSAFQVSAPSVIFMALALGVLIEIVRRGRAAVSLQKSEEPIQSNGRQRSFGLRGLRSAALTVVISAVLWTLPLAVLYFHSSEFPFWATLILFFTKAAFVTVGGSYTVLPYIAQSAVAKLHWLSNLNMADGFALAETTPGPLIIVVAYVGFMAGYHHFHQSLWLASLALLLTTFYTFLPCFFFVFLGAPIVDKAAENLAVKRIMRLVTAVVTAAIANLAFYLAKPALLTAPMSASSRLDWVALLWLAVSVALLWRLRLNVVLLVILSALLGLGRHAFSF